MTKEEMIQKLRKDRDNGKLSANIFYNLLQSAHPNVVEALEQEAANFMMFGEQIRAHLEEVSKDPKKAKALREKMVNERNQATSFSSPDEDVDNDELD